MAKKPPAPSDLADKFMLRLPDGMRDRIAEAAEANKRSMNAEIVARLEGSFSASHTDENALVKAALSLAKTVMNPQGRDLEAFVRSDIGLHQKFLDWVKTNDESAFQERQAAFEREIKALQTLLAEAEGAKKQKPATT